MGDIVPLIKPAARPRFEITRSMRKVHPIYHASCGVVPAVTTCTGLRAKPGLLKWNNELGREHPEISPEQYTQDLARLGELVHHRIECRLLKVEPDLSDYTPNELSAALPALEKFERWSKDKTIEVIGIERPLVSEAHLFGGTIDVFAVIDGRRAVCDIKTSKGIYDEHLVQTSAYAELLKENGEHVDEIRILRVGRVDDDSLEEKRVTDWDRYWRVFLALLEVYWAERALRR